MQKLSSKIGEAMGWQVPYAKREIKAINDLIDFHTWAVREGAGVPLSTLLDELAVKIGEAALVMGYRVKE